MQYKWAQDPQGQFVDGHEWEDIVTYLQQVFLPCWEKLEHTMHKWGDADLEELAHGPEMCHTFIWNHDKLTYYANNWCKICWVHWGKQAILYAKGEGVTLMVVDFVSANYGWLHSPVVSQQAWVLFKAGKAWEGNFTNNDIHQGPIRKPCFCF